MKVMVEQIDIVETLTPMSFNSFRDRLDTASGFQSSQFREFEFLLGYKRADLLRFQQPGTPAYEQLVRRLNEPSVVDAFYDFLEQHGVDHSRRIAATRRDAADACRTRRSKKGSCACTKPSPTWRSCLS